VLVTAHAVHPRLCPTAPSRHPQFELIERMTEQIAALTEKRLPPAGVMVVVQARHLCLEMRGVGKPRLTTTTSAIRGVFEVQGWRQKPYALLPPPRWASDVASPPVGEG
jgi:GTP cyclohydrolase I